MIFADKIALYFRTKGVDTAFGIIGSSNAMLFDSFKKYGIRIVHLHHEQACVMASSGYFKTTLRPAIVLVAAGGGATNAVTGVADMWADSVPCFVISGQESSKFLEADISKRMYGMQGVQGHSIVGTITKFSKVFSSMQDVSDAWRNMMEGRLGPVWLDVPIDIQKFDPYAKVFEALNKSARPVILAGHGVKLSGSTEQLKKINIPVLTSWSAIDVQHPLNFGCPGIYGNRCANKIIQKSDFLLVLGSRLAVMQTGYDFEKFAPGACIVHVNVDESDLKGHLNLKESCEFIISDIVNLNIDVTQWIAECEQIAIENPFLEKNHTSEKYTNSYQFIHNMLSPRLTDEVVVTDMGTALISGHNTIRLKEGNTMFSSYGLGEMGYGLPSAIGASIAGRRVICLNCDGSMMMNLQELQSIACMKLDIKIIIFNNDGYLSIKHTQKLFKVQELAVSSASGIVLPNYTKVCESFGIKVFSDFEEFMKVPGPSMYEVMMDPDQPFTPKVHATQEGGVIVPGTIEVMS